MIHFQIQWLHTEITYIPQPSTQELKTSLQKNGQLRKLAAPIVEGKGT